MKSFKTLTSRIVCLPMRDIDTDQIIPARFLKVTDKVGLGAQLFYDWRYKDDGSDDPDFALNRPGVRDRQILVAGANFGCGSSREHAPWALADWGFSAIIAPSFADIFRQNALKNGLLPVEIAAEAVDDLVATANASVTIDLAAQIVELPGGERRCFPVDPFAKRCLLEGVDELGYLLSLQPAIDAYERTGEQLPE
jgi:3-isopropylmalate/(R)-2-methylmalate dehydratase small subunit